MKEADTSCPFKIGDRVRFVPGPRTRGLYQDVEAFGVSIGEVREVVRIKDDTYLHLEGGAGGWPWTEFESEDGKIVGKEVAKQRGLRTGSE
jgi:hypothetical protein